jgi:hypothetical protein
MRLRARWTALQAQVMKETRAGPKRRRLQERQDLVDAVATGDVSQDVLERKLLEHVDSVDADMVRPLPFQGHNVGSQFTHLRELALPQLSGPAARPSIPRGLSTPCMNVWVL